MSKDTSELLEASTSPTPPLLRLQQYLSSSPQSIDELVSFLDSTSDSAILNPGNQDSDDTAFEVLSEIHRFLSSPSTDQDVIDALSFELPKAVSKFGGVSNRCFEIVDSIIDCFVEKCSPRDMLSILCEALDSPSSKTGYASGSVAPLLSGLSKVFLLIQRRHFEQVKVAVPVILKVVKAVSSELADRDVEDAELMNLFSRALGIARSIHDISTKLEGRVNEKLHAQLGLYVLQIMALLSLSIGFKTSSCVPLVSELSTFFPYCGLSYIGLITGSDVDAMVNVVIEESTEEDNYISCLSHIKHGASLSVIWGHISDAVRQAAGENMSTVKDDLRINQFKRWQAVGMLKYVLSPANVPWELKKHAIDFLLSIIDGNNTQRCNDEHDCSVCMPSLCATVEAITKVIMYSPNTTLRRNAFEALKRVLGDTPTLQRLGILRALISNSDSPSMVAILLDIVRGELHKESCHRLSQVKDEQVQQNENEMHSMKSLWTAGVLEMVELVLRPPKGGPPSFPEQGETVLAALNLYRFILITESAGKTNFTGVLSKNNLQKAYNEWLLPLRTLVTGIMAENKADNDEFAVETACALNPVELVLYRCIELIEDKLK